MRPVIEVRGKKGRKKCLRPLNPMSVDNFSKGMLIVEVKSRVAAFEGDM